MFNERKVSQMAAYFLHKRGGTMSVLKLMKLLYLADRESMRLYAMPMSGDKMASLPHGPVLSRTLDLIDGNTESAPEGWEFWVTDRASHEVSLNREVKDRENLDELSDADIEILDEIWTEFGRMGRWEVRDYTHTNCHEWRDPNGSANPISYSDVFVALGYPKAKAQALADRIEGEREIDRIFAVL